MPLSLPTAFAYGLFSAALFVLVALLGMGPLMLFLPMLPISYLALAARRREALAASAAGALAIALATTAEAATLYWVFLAFPAWHVACSCLRRTPEGEWQPVTLALLDVALLGCAALLTMTLFYYNESGGIGGLVAEQVGREMTRLGEAPGTLAAGEKAALQRLAGEWAFLVFASSLWLWVLMVYAHSWAANRLLAARGQALRPGLALTPCTLPRWLPGLLAIAGFASLAGSPSLQFFGKAALVVLMLPYLLQALALVHTHSKGWPGRPFMLFFLYVMLAGLLWPLLVLAFYGVYDHIKRLSGGVPSAKH
jgi:hypothetical protein